MVGLPVNRPEEIGRLGQILAGELEEEILAGEARRGTAVDRVVVGAALDGQIEDRGVAGEPGDRKLFDVTPQGAVLQHLPGHVVEPEALAQIVELLGWVCHDWLTSVRMSYSIRSPMRSMVRSAGGYLARISGSRA